MTSRPAAPESETPEVDAVRIDDLGRTIIWTGVAENKLLDLARSLERRLSLAQTEIKGHMRVEDELKTELQEARRELGMIPIGWQPKHDYLLGELAKAQARTAELEKVLGGVLAEADRDTDSFIAARAALKDRA